MYRGNVATLKLKKMKKLILLSAILLISFVQNAQVTLVSVNPIICPGDSIMANFKFNNQSGTTNFRIDYVINTSPIGAHIWSKNNNDFYSLPKTLQYPDTIYTIKLQTSFAWQLGRAEFKVQQSSQIFTIEVNCGPVGIQENSLNTIEPIYFDLMGNLVQPIKNVVLIKQTGLTRKKVVITD